MENRKRIILFVIIISLILLGTGIGLGTFFGINKPTRLFIAIHCEPGSFPATTDYPEQYWFNLLQMISQADQNDVKLNLLFNPQWGSYILQNTTRFSLVRSWESNGHEIGLHVHGPNQGSWCGYTNQAAFASDPKYLGTIAEMMVIMNQLPAFGQILTTCSATDEDIIFDYPVGVLFRTSGGSEKMNHLWSKPTTETFTGQSTAGFNHARYGNIQSDINKTLTNSSNYTKSAIMNMLWD